MTLPTWAEVGSVVMVPVTGVTAWVLGGRIRTNADVAHTRADTANITAQATRTTAETAERIVEASGDVVQLMREQIADLRKQVGIVAGQVVRSEERHSAQVAELSERLRVAEERNAEQTARHLHALQQRDAALAQAAQVIAAWTAWARDYQPWAVQTVAILRQAMLNAPPPPPLPDLPTLPIIPPDEAVEWATTT